MVLPFGLGVSSIGLVSGVTNAFIEFSGEGDRLLWGLLLIEEAAEGVLCGKRGDGGARDGGTVGLSARSSWSAASPEVGDSLRCTSFDSF